MSCKDVIIIIKSPYNRIKNQLT